MYLAKIAIDAGHDTLRLDDRAGNTDVSLAARVDMANEWNAYMFCK